jgi:hypothetical protein
MIRVTRALPEMGAIASIYDGASRIVARVAQAPQAFFFSLFEKRLAPGAGPAGAEHPCSCAAVLGLGIV